MRQQGRLTEWNVVRGFGFVTPLVFLVALGLRRRDVSDTGATSAGVVPAMVPDPP